MSIRSIVLGVIAVGAVGVAACAWYLRGPGPTDFAAGQKVPLAEYGSTDPTGVPASLAQASLIERGKYLAHAADCMVCHTAAGGAPYAGGLGFKLPFGTLYSTNITPDRDTGIGAYSDQDFLDAVQRGKRPDGSRLYPAMPYPSYSYMTDADALAIKAYLFSLEPVRSASLGNTLSFPFNQRWGMTFWSALFNADKRFEPNADQSPQWNRGAYLAEALAHCGDCHTERNLGFALNNRKKFGGAVTAGWRAYNISSDESSGLGDWTADEIATYLSTGHAAGRGTASGPMGEAVDHSFSKLESEDITSLVSYLQTVPAIRSADLPVQLAPVAPTSHKQGGGATDQIGKRVFEGACVSCHGWTGKSTVSAYATLTGARSVNDPSAINVAQIVVSGTERHIPEGVLSMPAFGKSLSNEEVAAVANYVTARFGSEGSTIRAADVAALREQTAD